MNILKLIGVCLFVNSTPLFAQQANFITNGSITYEKTVNNYALIRKGEITGKNTAGNEQQLLDQYQQTNPQFKTLKSTLTFNAGQTLFVPIDAEPLTGAGFNIPISAQNNIIYTDHGTGLMNIKKNLLGDLFLLTDSIRKVNWKITDETREVAGYTCRRANAIVMDSIYVVAFFTERIHVSGGPESFSGLPGMILELALPHENVIWKATKITASQTATSTIIPPKGGKAINKSEFTMLLKNITKEQNAKAARLFMKTNLL